MQLRSEDEPIQELKLFDIVAQSGLKNHYVASNLGLLSDGLAEGVHCQRGGAQGGTAFARGQCFVFWFACLF